MKYFYAVFYTVLLYLFTTINFTSAADYRVRENSSPGTDVGFLSSEYSNLLNGKAENRYFTTEATSGNRYKIRTRNLLDREDPELCGDLTRDENCEVDLDVWYIDSRGQTKVRLIGIEITDEDDNPPVFKDTSQRIEIAESTPVFSEFLLDQASDLDTQENGILRYVLESSDRRPTSTFSLKTKFREADGAIICRLVVADLLDYEASKQYTLQLTAVGRVYNASLPIFVTILDVNDNGPVFDESNMAVLIAEDTRIGKVVSRVSASDIDEGENGRIEFSFSEESIEASMDFFSIDKDTGEIKLKRSLREQGGTKHEIMIIVRDKGEKPLQDVMTWNFEIQDINDYPPAIKFTTYTGCYQNYSNPAPNTFYLPENQPRDTVLGYFLVVDKDDGDFGLTSLDMISGSDVFKLASAGQDMYILSAKEKFDRDIEQTEYKLQLRAWDCAGVVQKNNNSCKPLYTEEEFTFIIADENDNRPRFDEHTYEKTLTEENGIPRNFITVRAVDIDAGENGTVEYSIINSYKNYFTIDKKTGSVSANEVLDREVLESEFELKIRASDKGKFPKFTDTSLQIHLLDINDSPPRFQETTKNLYIFSVYENSNPSESIGQILAVDPDEDNAKITYTMQYSGRIPIRLDTIDGRLYLKESLDYETLTTEYPSYQGYFEFTVIAKEESTRKVDHNGQSEVTVRVQIHDVNDHGPVIPLEENEREVVIPWDAYASYKVTKIFAVDQDITSVLSYTIPEDSVGPRFGIDSTTGQIYLKQDLTNENDKDRKFKIDVDVTDSMHKVPWMVVVHLSGNWTLFNHTSMPPHNFATFITEVPRMVLYLAALVILIVVILIIIWMALLIKFRRGHPARQRRPKQPPPMAYHQQEHQFAHPQQGPQPSERGGHGGNNATLQKQYRKSTHEEEMDMANVMTPFLKTFNELGGNKGSSRLFTGPKKDGLEL